LIRQVLRVGRESVPETPNFLESLFPGWNANPLWLTLLVALLKNENGTSGGGQREVGHRIRRSCPSALAELAFS
jgi:hypothetical protein